MKVSELIAKLFELPQDAKVGALVEGGDHMDVDVAYLTKSGRVLLAEFGDVVYRECDRPMGAPAVMHKQTFWEIPRPAID